MFECNNKFFFLYDSWVHCAMELIIAAVVLTYILYKLNRTSKNRINEKKISRNRANKRCFKHYNAQYNMVYYGQFIIEAEEEYICFFSEDKAQYIAELKLKTIIFLYEDYPIDFGYLFYGSKKIKVILSQNDRYMIKKMLENMNCISNMDYFDTYLYKCNTSRCDACYEKEVCFRT